MLRLRLLFGVKFNSAGKNNVSKLVLNLGGTVAKRLPLLTKFLAWILPGTTWLDGGKLKSSGGLLIGTFNGWAPFDAYSSRRS